MKKKYLITLVIGTRPEAIKLAPVIKVFLNSNIFETRVILSGQHKEMVNEILELFNIKENKNLNIITKNQSLNTMIANMMCKLNEELIQNRPNLLIVQGDTSSAFGPISVVQHPGSTSESNSVAKGSIPNSFYL